MINSALLKEQLKRFWGLSALIFAGYTLTIALPIYRVNHAINLRELAFLMNMQNEIMIFSVFAAPLIAVVVLFKFQNQVKSATVMHSYPLTRSQLLTTNALAVMILLVLPLLAFCIIIFFPIHQFFCDSFAPLRLEQQLIFPVNPQLGALSNSLLVISRFFFISVLSLLFYLSLYMVAVTLSGNSYMTILLSAILLLLPVGLYMLIMSICQLYVFGFYPLVNDEDYLVYIHPILFSQWWERNGYSLLPVVSHVAIIIAMVICSIITSDRRAQEKVGNFVVFPYVKNVLIFILSVCGALVLGYIFYDPFVDVSDLFLGLVIGFIITHCIAQMIAEKTFNLFNKMKDIFKFGAVAFGFVFLIIILTRYDVFGFERHVPHLADIEGVQMLDVHFLYDNRNKLANTTLNELLVKDIEIINETITLHQTIINERETLMKHKAGRRGGYFVEGRHFNLLYKLKGGKVIVRTYLLSDSLRSDSRELQARSKLFTSLLQNRPYLINGIELALPFHSNDWKSEISISRHDHILALISALKKDHELFYQTSGFGRASDDSIVVRIIFEPEGLNLNHSWINSLSFEIAYSDRSLVRSWLLENGY